LGGIYETGNGDRDEWFRQEVRIGMPAINEKMNNDGLGPIVVCGMHRSGTSVLSQLLDLSGIEMGHFRDANHESYLYLFTNRILLQKLGVRWDTIKGLPETYSADHINRLTRLAGRLTSGWVARQLFNGWGADVRLSKQPWGWKDPRNCVLLPVWLQLFPNLKVIYLERDGLDVALSLQTRAQKTEQAIADQYDDGRLISLVRILFTNRCGQYSVEDLDDGIALWAEYIERFETAVRNTDVPVFRLSYEELTADPVGKMGEIHRFAGLQSPMSESVAEALLSKVRAPRKRTERELTLSASSRALLGRRTTDQPFKINGDNQ